MQFNQPHMQSSVVLGCSWISCQAFFRREIPLGPPVWRPAVPNKLYVCTWYQCSAQREWRHVSWFIDVHSSVTLCCSVKTKTVHHAHHTSASWKSMYCSSERLINLDIEQRSCRIFFEGNMTFSRTFSFLKVKNLRWVQTECSISMPLSNLVPWLDLGYTHERPRPQQAKTQWTCGKPCGTRSSSANNNQTANQGTSQPQFYVQQRLSEVPAPSRSESFPFWHRNKTCTSCWHSSRPQQLARHLGSPENDMVFASTHGLSKASMCTNMFNCRIECFPILCLAESDSDSTLRSCDY